MSVRAQHRRQDRERARAARRQGADSFPMIPGVIPVDTEEWRKRAMAEAHEVLAPLSNTSVTVWIFDRADGVKKVEELFGAGAAVVIAAKLATSGPAAAVTVAGRVPHHLSRSAEPLDWASEHDHDHGGES